jgi:hypothetical protein
LIIAAVLCGLAILGAGTAFLVRTSANKDRLTVPEVFQVGQVGRAGGAEVRVVSVDVGAIVTTLVVDVTVLDVTAGATSRPIADLAAPFALASLSTITKPNGTAGSSTQPTCRGLAAVPNEKRTCSLAFDVHPSGSFFVSFATPAGGQVQWRLSA